MSRIMIAAFAALTVTMTVLAGAPSAAALEITAMQVQPRLDLRATRGGHMGDSLGIKQAEINLVAWISHDGSELVNLNLQHNFETPMTGRAEKMHFSNLYAVFNLGVGEPAVKVGQFVVPFGTLAEFDTHEVPLQTPYARTLGIRIDRGIALEGRDGEWDWSTSLTTGDGRERHDGGWAGIARVARDYEMGHDIVRVGVSGLVGRNMPVFPTNPMDIPMGLDDEVEHVDKWRVALDLDWLRGIDNIRAEFVFGGDDGEFVDGQWLYYEHPFSYDSEIVFQGDRWNQPDGTSYGVGVQYHHRLDDWSGIRVAAERRWADLDRMSAMSEMGHGAHSTRDDLFTVQYYRDWAWVPEF